MSTSLLLLLAMLTCFLIAGGVIWHTLRRHVYSPREPSFSGAKTRKLTPEELATIEQYLELSSRSQDTITPSGASAPPSRLQLSSRSHTVISLTHAITRYSFSVDDTNQWRFYLDSTEIHLPLLWEQYITNDNDVELILTDTLPLVISLNGHRLQNYSQEISKDIVPGHPHQRAFIRREESTPIELLATRQETPEEHTLNASRQVPEAILICIAFIVLVLSVLGPSILMPWLVGGALLLIAASLWSIFSPVTTHQLREIHNLRGIPKRWGLFGESNHDQINNISLGVIDLVYPAYWQPYITQDLGQKTNIDIYLGGHVVRQGNFLSLHDEVRLFPLQRWLRPLIIACGSLTALLMMVMWVPLEMPLKISSSWFSGAKTIEVSSLSELDKYTLHVGDTLKVSGIGSCHINTPDDYSTHQNPSYLPFDCSKIRWKESAPQPLADSEMAQQAQALVEVVNSQINPTSTKEGYRGVNPQLEAAIQKSDMILLNDFSGIVQKTQALCHAEGDCVRLKNALINLGNTKDWNTLVKRVETGKLIGVNVVLRPVSADALHNLIIASTAPFFVRDIIRTAQTLNTPIAGGYILINDEGRDLAHTPQQASLYDYPVQEQWSEFMSLAKKLSQVPFTAKGVITNTYTNTNGTQHVVLQNINDTHSHLRYTVISLLLLSMLICYAVSSIIAINRYRRDRRRLAEIQQYYDRCLKSSSSLHLKR
ncbi:IgaA/UmoB family intracellular growth attenuator [uncultured Cedecea sp.]|uniref:IgaA/UmoB family intracellular growth attenuator n=1 Tax=uncultured Cedecea sp. TaxID=988762 RepID=UPI00260D5112|nr:IgaA/UmoB family intracellular growth attenuator [uncultured Cedecea sp.]